MVEFGKTFLVLAAILQLTFSAKCGQSGMPFRLQVLADGTPVLGCAVPQCFGQAQNNDLEVSRSHSI